MMFGVLLLGLVPVLPAVADDEPETKLALSPVKSKKLPDSVRNALKNGNYTEAQNAIAESLKGKDISYKSAQELHLAMVHEVIRETGAEILSKYAAESPEKKEFLDKFMRDTEWLELYLSCGLVPHQKSLGVDILYRIWQEEKGKVKNKALAVALASCWGGGETWPEPPITKLLPHP